MRVHSASMFPTSCRLAQCLALALYPLHRKDVYFAPLFAQRSLQCHISVYLGDEGIGDTQSTHASNILTSIEQSG